jgi:hypothetical protein
MYIQIVKLYFNHACAMLFIEAILKIKGMDYLPMFLQRTVREYNPD